MDAFSGNWKIDLDASRVWDSSTDTWVPDPVGREDIHIEVNGDVHSYENLCRLNPTYRIGYEVRYGDMTWTPYMVYETVDDGESLGEMGASGDTRRVQLKVGEPLSLVVLVKIDETLHYRLSKNLDGTPGYVLQRRLDDDGRRFTSTIFMADGTVPIVKVFDKVG